MKVLSYNDLKLLVGTSIEEIEADNDCHSLTINGVSVFNVYRHDIFTFENNHPLLYLELYDENDDKIGCATISKKQTLYINMSDDIKIK